MHQSLVMTVLGKDRPGIVRALSEIVAHHGGSWQESRLVRLAGQFAGVVRVDGQAENLAALHAELKSNKIPELSLHTVLEDAQETMALDTLRVEVTGNDRPGIIRELAAAIATTGGNVEELHTELESAPMSGHSLFRAHCRIAVSSGVDVGAILAAIENLGPDLTADVMDGTAR